MTITEINKTYNRIIGSLDALELKNAFDHIQGLMAGCRDYFAQDRLDELQNTYRYLLRYRMDGAKDPMQDQIYRDLRASAYELADAVRNRVLATESPLAYYSRRRILRNGGQAIDICSLLQEPAPSTLLFEILHPLGFNESQTDAICRSLTDGQPGKRFETGDWQVVRDRECLLIERREETAPPCLDMQTTDYTPGFDIPRDRHTACLDADKLEYPLTLRLWQKGDTFVPFGMTGRKKVSDYLTDRKVPLSRKERQWVLCSGNDIAWLVGERSDNRFRIDSSTRRVIIVRVISPDS